MIQHQQQAAVRSRLNNQQGQLLVEAVLLMALAISVSLMVSNYLKQSEFAQKLVAKPWVTLSGMIECGVWTGCGPGKHPNAASRNLSFNPNK